MEDETDTDPDLKIDDGVIIVDRPPEPDATDNLVVTFRPKPSPVTIFHPKPRTFPRATRPPTDER